MDPARKAVDLRINIDIGTLAVTGDVVVVSSSPFPAPCCRFALGEGIPGEPWLRREMIRDCGIRREEAQGQRGGSIGHQGILLIYWFSAH